MGARDEFIRQIQDESTHFRDMVAGMDEHSFEEKRNDQHWGYREVAAHLTGRQGEFAARIKQATEGRLPGGDVDLGWNEAFIEHARGKRRDQVLRELDDGVAHVVEAVRAAPAALFEEGAAGAALCRQDVEQFREHAQMVQQLQGA